VVRAGHGGEFASDFETQGLVAVGFGQSVDASKFDRASLRAQFAKSTPELLERSAINAADQLYRFAHEIKVGDWVITPDSETRELLFGEVTGEYRTHLNAIMNDFCQSRKVSWQKRADRDLLPRRVLYSLGSSLTVFIPKGGEYLDALVDGRPMPAYETTPSTEDETDEAASLDLYGDLKGRAEELIKQRISALDGYQTQNFTAGVFRAMGYFTQVSPRGNDGRVDIVVSSDRFGVMPPVIKVQVKARPDTKSSGPDISTLVGTLTQTDRGIFVSTGGFTADAKSTAMARGVSLINLDQLYEMFIEHWEKLDMATQKLVPLGRLLFPL
jgi:restriction system protein